MVSKVFDQQAPDFKKLSIRFGDKSNSPSSLISEFISSCDFRILGILCSVHLKLSGGICADPELYFLVTNWDLHLITVQPIRFHSQSIINSGSFLKHTITSGWNMTNFTLVTNDLCSLWWGKSKIDPSEILVKAKEILNDFAERSPKNAKKCMEEL